ncbi:MAG: hypothetical protein RL095_3500, partial [Verrucomicrobiota bacterium]
MTFSYSLGKLTISESNPSKALKLSSSWVKIQDAASNSVSFEAGALERVTFLLDGVATTNFTLEQLKAGRVSLLHDGSSHAPSFVVTATSGSDSFSVASSAANLSFKAVNDKAVILQDMDAVIEEDGSLELRDLISLSDEEDGEAGTLGQAVYTAKVSSGKILVAGQVLDGKTLKSFTHAQVLSGDVVFVHDGSEKAPSISLSVKDSGGLASSLSLNFQAGVNFERINDRASISTTRLVVQPGIASKLSAGNFKILDPDSTANSALIHLDLGSAYTLSYAGSARAEGSFTYAELKSGKLSLSLNQASLAPNLRFSVEDGDGATSSGALSVQLKLKGSGTLPVPSLTPGASLAVLKGLATVLDSDFLHLSHLGSDVPSGTLLSASAVKGGYFTFSGLKARKFTLQDLQDGLVGFVQAGSGPVSFSLKATNAFGKSSAALAFKDVVVDQAPVITSATNLLATEDSPALYTAAATDADGHPLSYSLLSSPTQGSISLAGAQFTYTPNSDANGSDSFTFAVSDGYFTTTQTVSISIAAVNDAPVITSSASLATQEDQAVVYQAAATDIDSSNLTWSAVTPSYVTVYDDIDSSYRNWYVASPGVKGLVSVSGSVFTYTPNANANGSDSFVIAVSDGDITTTKTISVNITPINDAPVISGANEISTPEDQVRLYSSSAFDVDSANLTWSIVSQGSKGQVRLSDSPFKFTSDANYFSPIEHYSFFTYTPDANANGLDSFVIAVSDGAITTTKTISVNIAAVNDAPVISSAASLTTQEDQAVVYQAAATDIDSSNFTWSIASQGSKGLVSVSGSAFTYTPNADANGSDSFVIEVSDGELTTTQTISVSIAAVNDAPLLTSDTSLAVTEDTPATLALAATDIDGDYLSFSIKTNGSKGSASISGSTLTYTPAADANGSDSVVIEVLDGNGGIATHTLSVSIAAVNDAPVITSAAFLAVTEDTPATLALTATDIDGDSLSFSVKTQGGKGSASISGSSLSYTPAADANGSDSLVIEVLDGNGGISSQTISISIAAVNDAPLFTSAATLAVAEDTPATLALAASDVDGDILSFSIKTNGSKGSASISGSSLTYTPAADANGPDSVVIEVSDGNGGLSSQTISVSIAAVNDAPESTSAAFLAVTEDTPATLALAASDVDGDTLSFSIKTNGSKGSASISGSTLTYTPAADANGSDSVVIEVSDGHGGIATQSVSINIAAVNDAPSGSLWISGGLVQGQTVSAAHNLVDPENLGALSFSWRDSNGQILGQDPNLLLSENEVGKSLILTASFVDGDGHSESVTVTSISTVINRNDPPTGSVTISGDLTQGQTLTASNTLADLDGLGEIT